LSIINRKNPRFIFLKRLFVDFSTSVEYNSSTDVEFVFKPNFQIEMKGGDT